jgi:hypothetical protein
VDYYLLPIVQQLKQYFSYHLFSYYGQNQSAVIHPWGELLTEKNKENQP